MVVDSERRYNPCPSPACVISSPLPRASQALNQGSAWTQSNRAAFYSQDQGSQIMPLAWFKALRREAHAEVPQDFLATLLHIYLTARKGKNQRVREIILLDS